MPNLSPALVRRLPDYFRILIKFYSEDKERINSEELAQELGLVPSQVRTDIKSLGCAGQRSYGYVISTLYKRIADILQLADKFSAVIVGDAPLVQSVAECEIFAKRGIRLTAVFEEQRGAWSRNGGYEVKGLSSLEDFLKNNSPSIVILGASDEVCSHALMLLEHSGGKPTVWNFATTPLESTTLTVKNIRLCDLLMLLCYEIGKEESK